MRKLLIAAIVALCLPLALAAQDNAQKRLSKIMSSDEISLNIMHLNAKTVPVLFQPPTLYSMRARAGQKTMVYVQTVVENNGELDTTNFVLEQGGTSTRAPDQRPQLHQGQAEAETRRQGRRHWRSRN